MSTPGMEATSFIKHRQAVLWSSGVSADVLRLPTPLQHTEGTGPATPDQVGDARDQIGCYLMTGQPFDCHGRSHQHAHDHQACDLDTYSVTPQNLH
ncbi:hypothetical protein VitviT2T_011918 [Vitis vinifera]|uniref:Uncharacterized protein n=1 Tax=Vitis vinifera TaxID=29760 RepID=A0ABY9CEL0_VITVI|nr:hypothetical protein VitviT2T_011918 [Vitis vinifera]